MKSVFENFTRPSAAFRPESESDFFALLLAKRLGESAGVRHFAAFASQYPRERLLVACKHCLNSGQDGNVAKRFRSEVERAGNYSNGWYSARLLCLRVERRSVTAVIMDGDRIHYVQTRQLASDRERAVASAIGFMNRLLSEFEPESAAIEPSPNGDIQRAALTEAIITVLRQLGVPVWEISKNQLFEAFGYPPLRSRKELRQTICSIWPALAGTNGKHFVQDSAALGLYVQTERLFLN